MVLRLTPLDSGLLKPNKSQIQTGVKKAKKYFGRQTLSRCNHKD
jgi:hypothetical protein